MSHNIVPAAEWRSKSRRVAGIMSGTSMDGIDVAIADFHPDQSRAGCTMEHITTVSTDYSDEQRQFLMTMVEQPQTMASISDLPVLLSTWYDQAVQQACRQIEIPSSQLDAIGVHGQTLWHAPNEHEFLGTKIRSTFQCTSVPVLAQLSKSVVVGDFRSADVALGGQGAPLVPIFDAAFLHSTEEHRVALNIGGMANVSVLEPDLAEDQLIAFDTGPGNVWIDAAMQQMYGRAYDDDGQCARSGSLDLELMNVLKSIEYIKRPPPKSTGREEFSRASLHQLIQTRSQVVPAADFIHTLSVFTAWSIAENIRQYAPLTQKVIVSGGGSKNSFLMHCLEQELDTAIVTSSDQLGIPSKSKESLCFAYLAWRSLAGMSSNLPSVSGAKRRTILGVFALPASEVQEQS